MTKATNNKKTILIIAPHPDDEIVGCGGVYLHNAHKGNNITILYLTKGALPGEDKRAKLRKEAVKKIASDLGVDRNNQIFLENHELGDLLDTKKAKTAITTILNIITISRPDEVYVPAYEGGHIDHDLANLFVSIVRDKNKDENVKYQEYEVYNNHIPFSFFGAKKLIQICIREAVKSLTHKYFYWDESRFPPNKDVKAQKLQMNKKEIEQKLEVFEKYRQLAEKPLDKKEPRKLLTPYKAEDLLREMPKHDYSRPPHRRFPLPLGYELAWKIEFQTFSKAAKKLQKDA
jgi:LmbE family N-acetylglucosaminyl deacetylase